MRNHTLDFRVGGFLEKFPFLHGASVSVGLLKYLYGIAQRPDASVLAGYDAWLEMDLPVARGSKGIAVFPSKIFGEGVTHVYDIQDVKGQGIRPWNWQVNGTNRRLAGKRVVPEIYEQEKKFKNL